MPYCLEPDRPLGDELRRVALECLDDALERLAHLGDPDVAPEVAVHEVRKRCKELRGLARLARPGLGDRYPTINAEARDAAKELSSVRDAHALLETIEDLQGSLGEDDARRLDTVRGYQRVRAEAATHGLGADDPRITLAIGRLRKVRTLIDAWDVPDDVSTIAGGIERTYRRGSDDLAVTRDDPDDENAHELRKRVKYLWYQTRLLEPADPQAIGALVEDLDELSDLLGDDHDLAVLVEQLERSAGELGDEDVEEMIGLVRARQSTLRDDALDLGGRVHEREPSDFVADLMGRWTGAVAAAGTGPAAHRMVERERKFLVADLPDLPDNGTRIRQGYLALDGDVAVRIREREGSGRTLTIKGGGGAARTEVEWRLGQDRFEALWPLTAGRRIEKTRSVLPVDGGEAEVDIFGGDLAGLVLVEVEFDSDDQLTAFEPPAWFGSEVTDDRRYNNAGLATDGRPD